MMMAISNLTMEPSLRHNKFLASDDQLCQSGKVHDGTATKLGIKLLTQADYSSKEWRQKLQ
jgi:hypothetical protein